VCCCRLKERFGSGCFEGGEGFEREGKRRCEVEEKYAGAGIVVFEGEDEEKEGLEDCFCV